MSTFRDKLIETVFDAYVAATEGHLPDPDDFEMYEPEDQGVVLRIVHAAIVAAGEEVHGLDWPWDKQMSAFSAEAVASSPQREEPRSND